MLTTSAVSLLVTYTVSEAEVMVEPSGIWPGPLPNRLSNLISVCMSLGEPSSTTRLVLLPYEVLGLALSM